jgi:hypothetical protein
MSTVGALTVLLYEAGILFNEVFKKPLSPAN